MNFNLIQVDEVLTDFFSKIPVLLFKYISSDLEKFFVIAFPFEIL